VKIAPCRRNRPGCFKQDAGLSLGFQAHPVKAVQVELRMLWTDKKAGMGAAESWMLIWRFLCGVAIGGGDAGSDAAAQNVGRAEAKEASTWVYRLGLCSLR